MFSEIAKHRGNWSAFVSGSEQVRGTISHSGKRFVPRLFVSNGSLRRAITTFLGLAQNSLALGNV